MLLSVLLFLGFATQTQAQKNWIEFKKDNYQIKYPETWIIDSSGTSSTDFIISSPLSSPDDRFKENLNLIIQDLKGLNFDLDNFTALSEQQIQNYMEESEVIENERLKKDGQECQHLIYTAKNAGRILRFEQYYWIINEKAYVLSFTGELEGFEEYKTLSKQIFESFVLK
jgi:serine/threonine-protein kinase